VTAAPDTTANSGAPVKTDDTQLMDVDGLATRFRDYGVNTLNPIVTMMMSGVFATAALALADILRTPDLRWVRLAIWLFLALNSSSGIIRSTCVNLLFVRPHPSLVAYQLSYAFVWSAAFSCLPLSSGGPDGWLYALTAPIIVLAILGWVVPHFQEWIAASTFDPLLRPLINERIRHQQSTGRTLLIALPIYTVMVVVSWVLHGESQAWNAALLVFLAIGFVLSMVGLRRDLANYQDLVSAVERLRRSATSPR